MRNKTLILTAIAGVLLAITAYPIVATGAGGPGTVVLGSLEDKYEPVNFDHAMHSEYFAEGCGDCHHQHGGYEKQPCKGCHALDTEEFKGAVVQSFMSCGTCHGELNPSMPGMPSLKVAYHKQCFKCHRGMGKIGKSPAACTEQCHAGKTQL